MKPGSLKIWRVDRARFAAIARSGEGARLAGEIGEHALRDVLGQVRVAVELPQRHRIDKVQVAGHQFTERRFVALFGEPAQQFGVFSHVHSTHSTRPTGNPTSN